MKVLPIGSIIEFSGLKLMICGYGFTEDKCISACYNTLIFPFGFTKPERIIAVNLKEEYTVIFKGYINDEFERISRVINKRITVLEGLSDSDIKEIVLKLNSIEENKNE